MTAQPNGQKLAIVAPSLPGIPWEDHSQNEDGVLFPRKINGKYAMLSRPSYNGHTPFGDIYYSESSDFTHWDRQRFVMGATTGCQAVKIGAGSIPVETSKGWLLIYHGVLNSCNGFVYSFGAALLDLEEPWKVIARGEPYLLPPLAPYARTGDLPNVAFPCAAPVDGDSGRMAIYYGAADTDTALAFVYVDEVVGIGPFAAIEFAIAHDDSKRVEELPQAEIVLVGVSRAGNRPAACADGSRPRYIQSIGVIAIETVNK